MLKRIWDGPFVAPPMQQPISVGWVLLKLSETGWRLGVILLVVACLGAALLTYASWSSPPLSEKVSTSVRSQDPGCVDPGYPVSLEIANHSDKALAKTSVSFAVYAKGSSEDIVAPGSDTLDITDIIEPDYVVSYCIPHRPLKYVPSSNLILATSVSYAEPLIDQASRPAKPNGFPIQHKETKLSKVVTAIVIIPGILAFGFASWGLVVLFEGFFGPREKPKSGREDHIYLVAIFANFAIMAAASLALDHLGLLSWTAPIDAWSRRKGYADAATVLLFLLASPWPWLLVLAFEEHFEKLRTKRIARDKKAQSTDAAT